MKNSDKIQNLLPLGYLLLVVLGITKESIYYYQLGVNYIKYTSIMDILLSPIATLTQNYFAFGFVLLIFILHYYLPSFLMKNHHKNWVQKWFGFKKFDANLSQDEIQNSVLTITLRGLVCYLISIYVGFGFGDGNIISRKIKENKLKYNYEIDFGNNKETVAEIGSNSMYYFYMVKNQKNIKITPIAAIKSIEIINNKMFSN